MLDETYKTSIRIIPAYAGSTSGSVPPPVQVADHPRIRGEHSIVSGATCTMSGSSPHTRGARVQVVLLGADEWIIPAYAGSTVVPIPGETLAWDHPRIRGEHVTSRKAIPSGAGSSPHTRGALAGLGGAADGVRIIPAYAGSTRATLYEVSVVPDHPRIRGEHRMLSPGGVFSAGSSPHTRGARDTCWRRGRGRGYIPAYAGSTGAFHDVAERLRDHPRIRGAHR